MLVISTQRQRQEEFKVIIGYIVKGQCGLLETGNKPIPQTKKLSTDPVLLSPFSSSGNVFLKCSMVSQIG